jgi:hypothetical protein
MIVIDFLSLLLFLYFLLLRVDRVISKSSFTFTEKENLEKIEDDDDDDEEGEDSEYHQHDDDGGDGDGENHQTGDYEAPEPVKPEGELA